MNKTNLIDFDNEDCCKIMSPLIPAPKYITPRLSEVENNPFDKVLRIIDNENDPFECNTVKAKNNLIANVADSENKENIEYLISPIQTPVTSKKNKILSISPFHTFKKSLEDTNDISLSDNCDLTDISLHILSDSVLINDDFLKCFTTAYDVPLPESPVHDIYYTFETNTDENKLKVPLASVHNESTNFSSSNITFNNNIISETTSLSSQSAKESTHYVNTTTFRSESLGTDEMSSCNQLDSESLINNFAPRICMSARKPSFVVNVSESQAKNLNNSFSGFNYRDKNFRFEKFRMSDNYYDDSVFLEANKLADVFKNLDSPLEFCNNINNDITQCSPPWTEEEIMFVDCDEEFSVNNNIVLPEIKSSTYDKIDMDLKLKTENNNEQTNKYTCNNISLSEPVTQNDIELNNKLDILDESETKKGKELDSENNNEQTNKNTCSNISLSEPVTQNDLELNNKLDILDESETKKAKELLHNLTAILNNCGTVTDKRTLGESLLNSLALALNIENPIGNSDTETNKVVHKLQRSKSESRVSKNKEITSVPCEKQNLPKIKKHSAAPIKDEKNLKLKSDKDKIASKGPLKALIPLTNMAKSKKSISSSLTPPRQSSLFSIKKAVTPNDLKIKSPIAQSTPEVLKKSGSDIIDGTKRNFGFPISPLSKPLSSSNVSNVCGNSSLSPRHSTGSAQNINKANSSIPTIKSLSRRNSVSDISTSKTNSFDKSYENHQSVQLKRSSSFQKSSPSPLNNNKKYGLPGSLKSLKLVPKSRRTTAD